MAPQKPFPLEDIDPAAHAQAEAAARAAGVSLADWIARTIASRAGVEGSAAPPPAATPAADEGAAPIPLPAGEDLRIGLHAIAAKTSPASPQSAGTPAANAEELAALKLALSRIAASGAARAAVAPE